MKGSEIYIIVVSILTALAIFWIIYGMYKGSEDSKIGGIVTLVLIGVFFWGVIACTVPFSEKSEEVAVRITRGEDLIFITPVDFERVLVFDKKTDFNHINENTTFYVEKNLNAYGFEIGDTSWRYYYKINEEKYYNR